MSDLVTKYEDLWCSWHNHLESDWTCENQEELLEVEVYIVPKGWKVTVECPNDL